MRRFKAGELEEGFKIFYKAYLEGYRNRVLKVYLDESSKGDSFKYMKPVHFNVLLRDKDTHLIISKSEEDLLSFIDVNEMDREKFNQLASGSVKLRREFIKSVTKLDDYLDELHFNDLGRLAGLTFAQPNQLHLAESSKEWGAAMADWHYNQHLLTEALEKIVSPSINLTVVNTDEILERVNDLSFQYEFGESAKAYNAGLYLAAASTGGLALENILRLIIVKELGIDELPGETYIRTSLNKLNKKEVLPGRLHGAVDSLKNVRNSNSHTNIDPVKKTTVDHLFATIEDLSLFFNRKA